VPLPRQVTACFERLMPCPAWVFFTVQESYGGHRRQVLPRSHAEEDVIPCVDTTPREALQQRR